GAWSAAVATFKPVTCNSGSLTLTSPSTVAFSAVTLTGTNKTATASAALTPSDMSGNAAGWNVQSTSTTLTNAAGKTLPTTATTVTAATAAAASGPGGVAHVALVAAVEGGADLEDRLVVVVEVGHTGDRHAPELAVGLPGLDEARDPGVALEVGRLLRLGVGPHGDAAGDHLEP